MAVRDQPGVVRLRVESTGASWHVPTGHSQWDAGDPDPVDRPPIPKIEPREAALNEESML